MRGPTMNARLVGSIPGVKKQCGFEMETVLRMRPLSRKERDDYVLLEAQNETKEDAVEKVVLNPFPQSLTHSPSGNAMRGRTDSDSSGTNAPTEYHFNHVLPENTSQDKIYYTLGLPIVTDTMNSLKNGSSNRAPKTHLLLSMGVEGSGKTYTCFGGMTIPKRRASQDGLVPRLLDSLFSQSNHAGGNSKGFTVQVSMMQVTESIQGRNSGPVACKIHDLLANPSASSKGKVFGVSPMKKKNLNVRNMAARFERAIPSPVGRKAPKSTEDQVFLDANDLKPSVQSCRDITQAREVLQNGLQTSQEIMKGSQKCHLYITMQPVVDGIKFGDRISILDMAGLEKENSMRNTRGKESATSNASQAANDAVLNCMRVLANNAKVANMKSNTHQRFDDDSSDLSSVSRPKFSAREKEMPVPFQHHKVGMILRSIFSFSSTVKVTLLIAAYPGHADFHQKRMLLKEVEILHGSTLVASIISPVKDVTLPNVRSLKESKVVEEEREFDDFGLPKEMDGLRENAGVHRHGRANEPRASRTSLNRSSNRERMPQAVVVHGSTRKSTSPTKRSVPRAVRVEPNTISRGNKAPVAQIVTHSSDRYRQSSRPSAPDFSEIESSNTESAMHTSERPTDFPGIQLPRRDVRKSEISGYPVAARTRYDGSGQVKREPNVDFGEMDHTEPKLAKSRDHGTTASHDMKSPLGRSQLENIDHSFSNNNQTKTGEYHSRKENRNEHSSAIFEADFSKFEQISDTGESGNITETEEKLRKALQDKEALERICAQLEKENAELRKASREAGRKALQSQWTDQDEEEFQASRRLRREAQSKIKAPIHEHLERVNYIYDIKNQWCMTNKRHFSLSFPETFQRAPVLDMRDKNNEEEENHNLDSPAKENAQPNEAKVEKTKLKIRTSLTPPRRTPPKRVKSPAGLRKLRKLVGNK